MHAVTSFPVLPATISDIFIDKIRVLTPFSELSKVKVKSFEQLFRMVCLDHIAPARLIFFAGDKI